jgi:hypothetical protein
MRRLLMRVFSAKLWSSFLPWAEVGPLKGSRSRWTGIPWYPEHQHMHRLEANTKEKTTSQKFSPSATFHKRKSIYNEYKPPD